LNKEELESILISTKNNHLPLFHEVQDAEKLECLKYSPYYSITINFIKKSAALQMKNPVTDIPFSLFKIFFETGSRKEYEKEYFTKRSQLNISALLSLLYGKPEYIKSLEKNIISVCNEYTWCLPAHIKPEDLNNNLKNITIDLFSAETGFALAEILHITCNIFSKEVKNEILKQIEIRIFDLFLNRTFDWETWPMNWASVCAGSIGAAAVYLIRDNTERLACIIARVLDSMEVYLSGFDSDGACREGVSYWEYGFGFLVYFSEILRRRTNGKINFLESEKVRQISLFQQRVYLKAPYTVNFSDSDSRHFYAPGLACFLKGIFPEFRIPPEAARAGILHDPCSRWPVFIRNIFWDNPEKKGGMEENRSFYFEKAQWIVSAKKTGSSIACFAAKGGHNDEPHNHNDIGSFIIHVNGENLIADPGRGEYTKDYFTEKLRYGFFTTSSRGHSVPVINNCFQKAGPEYKSRDVHSEITEDKDDFVLDIAGAYNTKNLVSCLRKLIFLKKDNPVIILHDTFKFKSSPGSVIERFLTPLKPEILNSNKIRISGEKSSLEIEYDNNLFTPVVNKEEYKNHYSKTETAYLLDLILTDKKPEFSAEFVFTILTE
jgi:hypothetical protein